MSELDRDLRARLAALAHAEPSALDERRRARIRNAVHARAERRVLWPWLAFALVAPALILFMLRTPAQLPLPVAHELPMDARREPLVASAPAQTCAAVDAAELVAQPSGRRRLELARALVVADRDAELRVTVLTSCMLELSLRQGKLAVHARDLAGGRLVVRTPHGAVHVRGTVFGVEVSRDALEVPLLEGKVELERGDESFSLAAGQALRLDARTTARHGVSAAQRMSVLSWLGLQIVRSQPSPMVVEPAPAQKIWREGTPFTPPGPELPSSIQPDGRPMRKPPVNYGDKP